MDDMTSSPYPPFEGVEPYGTVRSVADERAHRKRMCALGYRIFGALRWGMLGDGHVSARDPELTDHFWLLDWGVPFVEATVGQSVEESIGWFVMAERVAEVHVKAPNGRPISDEAAAAAASTLAPDSVGWRMFQWLQRSLVPDRSVVD